MMFKKSRIKIVASIMSILVLILAGTLCIIYFTSYMDVYRRNQIMLERYMEVSLKDNSQDINFARVERQSKHIDNDNAYLLSTFYSVAFSADNEVLSIDNNDSNVYSSEELTELALSVLLKEKNNGTTGSLVYRIENFGTYKLVAFMDNTIVRESITSLFQYTLIFGSTAVILLFLLSLYLAKRIVQPLEDSYNKQKLFISDAGHELKTPVSVISTNAELLSREIGANQWLSNIQFENNRMAVLIKQLMGLAKTENVIPKMNRIEFSRIAVGESLAFESVAFEKGLKLEYDAISENVFLYGNEEQLGQLVSILLDNAIEHSPEHGTITVTLSVKHNKANLSVTNSGDEIPAEQRELIFERFYRTDFSRTGDDGHYGLGLAIAKAITTAHHGNISVSCKQGFVTFSVLLPVGHIY